MKKTIFQAIAIAITIIALAACQQAELNRPGEVKVKTASFRAILEEGAPQTKTTLGEKNSEGYYPVYWSDDDAIKIVTRQYAMSGGEGTRMELTSGAGTKEAVFTGEIPEKTDEFLYYYAIYPYHISASIGDAHEEGGDYYDWELAGYVEISLPSVQKYAPHSFAKDYNPAIAVTKDEVLRFKNICGLLQLNLTGDIKVSKITVEDLGGAKLWGTAQTWYRWNSQGETQYILEMQNDIGYGIGSVHNNSDASIRDGSTITLVCDTPVQLSSEPTDFYLAIPRQVQQWTELPEALSKGFILTIYDENGKAVYIQKTTEDNTIHRSMVREMPVINVSRKELTDLSANGGANSYIVAPGGTYKFYAGYRGNSVYPIPAAAAVEVLWETKNSTEEAPGTHGIIYDGVYNPETGYITFKTTNTQGNALIAIRDANDNILWSWHIWNTDYDPNAAGATSMVNGSYELMNRDLGAMSSDQVGLTYQWGRKDPFPNTFQYKTTPSDPFNTIGEEGPFPVNGNYGGFNTLGYTIEHPTTAIIGNEWADGNIRMELWGKNKTEYDPCPPGWQVMDFDAFQSICHRITGYQLWDYEQSGEFSFIFLDSDPPMFFPYEGNWTNRHMNYIGAFGINKDNFYLAAPTALRPLRCQRSSTVQDIRPVIDLSANGTANSYVVQPDKQYKFKATVKGNSNESVGAIAKVAFGYTTENNSTFSLPDYNSHGDEDVVGNMYLKDGYIYFSTSMDGHHGNSTILAIDLHGNVLWSWHIWCPEEDPTSNTYSFDGGDNVTYEMMSLNLGALNNNPGDNKSLGLMYQWGRKDPFLSARAWDSNSQAEYMGNHGSVSASAETSTLAYSISHPTTFIEGSTDWLSDPDNGLWGDTKTKYDPCPPGWKVPARPVWSSAHSVVAEFDPQYKGLTMGSKWYPAAGLRNSTSFNLHNVGLEGHYWYATPHDAGTAHAFYFYYQSSSSTDIDLNSHSDSKAQANSVRCVRE